MYVIRAIDLVLGMMTDGIATTSATEIVAGSPVNHGPETGGSGAGLDVESVLDLHLVGLLMRTTIVLEKHVPETVAAPGAGMIDLDEKGAVLFVKSVASHGLEMTGNNVTGLIVASDPDPLVVVLRGRTEVDLVCVASAGNLVDL